ncbi:MAG: T9SS type A sorting domain-containing protein [Sphingobacteriales bacterium]|nr:MAG: T9SS type A sorting domain-containing protein [Sphingobacteriales bacterium]
MLKFYPTLKCVSALVLIVLLSCFGFIQQEANATTCAAASTVVLPVTNQTLVCGAANDVIAANGIQCAGAVVSGTGSTSYLGGTEAMYKFTPTSTGTITISLNTTQTWCSIWLFNGCPGAGGICAVAVTTNTGVGNISSTVGVTAGTEYYVVFDSWPSPPSPCAAGAVFSITAPPPSGCLTAAYGLYPSTTFTPTCGSGAQTITTCGFASEYSNVNVVSGNSYTFSSSVATDFITISDAAGTVSYVAGTSPVNWVATYTGVARFYTHVSSACDAAGVCRVKSVACTTAIPGCLTAVNGLFPSATFTPTCGSGAQAITTCGYGSEYSNVNVISGNIYTFSSSVVTDYITIGDAAGTTVLAAGTTPVTWTANTTGVIRFYTHTNSACGAESVCRTKSVACSVPIPGCLNNTYSSPYPSTTFTPTCGSGTQTITTCAYASEYSNVNVVSGNNYTFSSSVGTYFITISDAGGTTVLASGVTPVTWAANITGVVRFYTHTAGPPTCGAMTGCTVRAVACTAPAPCFTNFYTSPYPSITFTPTCTGTAQSITTCGYASEYSNVNVVNGNNYTFSSSVATDFITISDAAGTISYAIGFGSATWSATFTGVVRFYTHLNTACGDQATCRIRSVACTAPTFDVCAGALPISCGGTYTGSTVGQTTDPSAGTCTTTLTTAPGVWYNLTGASGLVTLSLCGSGYDTKIGVFSGTCGALVCVAGNDDFCGLQSQLTFTATLGTTYYVLVTGFSTNTGAFTLNVTCLPPPANDNVCSAIPLVLGANPPYYNTGATTEAGEPVPPATGCSTQTGWCNSTISHSVWFTLVGPATGKVTISSTGFDNQLALYSAASCSDVLSGGATLLAANDDFNPGFASSINNVCVTPGTTYYVQMDGYNTTTGTSTITVIAEANNPPVLTACPANITTCANTATWIAPTATDDCSTPTVTGSHTSGGFFPNGFTTVTYTATDNIGATSTCSFTVHVAKITVTFNTTNVSCFGGSNGSATVIPVGGTGHTYSWSTGATGATASGLSAGSYFVTVTNAQGCSLVSLVNITQPPALNCNATSTNVNCNGDATGTASATASGGVGPYSYSWSNGATSANISGLVAGTYTVTVTDVNGCICTKTVTITEPPALQIVSAEVIVDGSGGTFYSVYQIVVAGGTLPYDVSFSVTGGFASYTIVYSLVDTDNNGSADSPGATIDVTYQASAIWTLTLDDAFGCGETQVFTNAAGSPILSIANALITADNGTATGAIALTVAGGTPVCPGYSYAWSGPSNWVGTPPNSATITGLPSGWYIVVVTDCSGEETFGWFWVPKENRGRGKLAEGQSLTAYPNPVNQLTTIEFMMNETAKASVMVHSIDGKQIAQLYDGVAEAGELYTVPFDASHLPNGLYMVTLTGENGFAQQFKLSVLH